MRIFFLLAIITVFGFLADSRDSWAAKSDVFVVQGIKVDVTAESTAAARDQALASGERLAFRELLERLTIRADHERLPIFSARDTATFIAFRV